MENIIEGLHREIDRVREMIKEYELLPKNSGMFAATVMRNSIKNAEKQIAVGDTVEMMKAYLDLEGYEL